MWVSTLHPFIPPFEPEFESKFYFFGLGLAYSSLIFIRTTTFDHKI